METWNEKGETRMKCPMCGGDTLNDLVVKGKMTNEEWLHTMNAEKFIEEVVEWLKQPHKDGKS